APINSRGSSTRRIGLVRSEASPSKTAVIGQPATAPITSRQPVPELPKSSGTGGCANPPTPTPRIDQANSPVRSTWAPSARIALAVLSTSSPSSRPEIRVSPTESAPRIKARCEIDLSPGTRTLPARGPLELACNGKGLAEWVKIVSSTPAAGITWAARRHATAEVPQSAIDSSASTSQVKHRFSKNSQDSARGQIRSRNQTHLPDHGQEILRSQQEPGDLALYWRGSADRAGGDAARATAAAATAEAAPEPTEAEELVPLEEADAEENTGKVKAVVPESEDDIEIDETLEDDDDDDSTFIPDEEEGDEDVTDIIGDVGGDEET